MADYDILNNFDVSTDGGRSKGKEQGRIGKAASEASREMNRQSVQSLEDLSRVNLQRTDETPRMMNVPSYKRGGKVKRDGIVRLHAGEKVKGRKKKARKSGRM